ncbi:ester cyclase [Streptomyces sp. NPDC001661]
MATTTHPQAGAFAPFADPEEFILKTTDQIWFDRGVGLVPERYYAKDAVVHGALGSVRGAQTVTEATLTSIAGFPDEISRGEDVVWEPRGRNSFVSSHRVLNQGTNTGWSDYGPPTGRPYAKRALAHCLVREGVYVEEWVVRDEAALVADLRLDAHQVALDLVARGAVGRPTVGHPPANVLSAGVSGDRPAPGDDAARRITELFDLYNARRFDNLDRYVAHDVALNTTRARLLLGARAYSTELIQMLAPFPDARFRLLDLCVRRNSDRGKRVAAVWLLDGTYSGVPVYGPPTGCEVQVLGATQFRLVGDKVAEEFRVYDEIGARAAVYAARGE